MCYTHPSITTHSCTDPSPFKAPTLLVSYANNSTKSANYYYSYSCCFSLALLSSLNKQPFFIFAIVYFCEYKTLRIRKCSDVIAHLLVFNLWYVCSTYLVFSIEMEIQFYLFWRIIFFIFQSKDNKSLTLASSLMLFLILN